MSSPLRKGRSTLGGTAGGSGWDGQEVADMSRTSCLGYICACIVYIYCIYLYIGHIWVTIKTLPEKSKNKCMKNIFFVLFFYFHYYMFHISLYITNIRKMFRISVFILVMMNTNYIFVHCSCFLFGQISNEARVARFLSYDC